MIGTMRRTGVRNSCRSSVDTAVINSGIAVASNNAQFSALTFAGGTLGGPVLVRSELCDELEQRRIWPTGR